MNTEKHPFEPFLPKGARILFLGSFPPQEHRWCVRFYYPNWINDFWRIVGLIFYADKNHFCIQAEKRFDEAAIKAFCEKEGLAFYDTACEVRRLKDNASDAFLEVVRPTDVAALLRQIPECKTLVTTGQKATEVIAETFGCEVPPVGGCIHIEIPDQVRDDGRTIGEDAVGRETVMHGGERASHAITFWRMPSTSRAYPLALEKKAEAYRKLFEQTKQ
jgi:G:T/U-mismatch repair DNA glycosylase